MADQGSPAAKVFKMLQMHKEEVQQHAFSAGYYSGMAVSMERCSFRGSPSKALQLLEMGSARADTFTTDARTGVQHSVDEQSEQRSVDSDFDPDCFFRSSLPSSQESPDDPQNAIHIDLPNASNVSNPENTQKRKNEKLASKKDDKSMSPNQKKLNALYQREWQKKCKQDRIDCEQQIQQQQHRIIQEGRQTLKELSNLLQKVQENVEASNNGRKLIMKIEALHTIKNRNGTQRSQLHRTVTKLRNLIIEEKKQALDEVSASNAMMSLSEAAEAFCAPT